MYCTNCGAEFLDNYKICEKCGRELNISKSDWQNKLLFINKPIIEIGGKLKC